jgi:hypothetical protein
VLGADIYEIFHHAAPWRLVNKRLLRLPFYRKLNQLILRGMRLFFDALLQMLTKPEKQNQSGILAQKIFVTQKTSGWNFS